MFWIFGHFTASRNNTTGAFWVVHPGILYWFGSSSWFLQETSDWFRKTGNKLPAISLYFWDFDSLSNSLTWQSAIYKKKNNWDHRYLSVESHRVLLEMHAVSVGG